MVRIRALIRQWRAEKDHEGRSIVYINNEDELEHYLAHSERLPAGDLAIHSLIPLTTRHQELLQVAIRTRAVGGRVGLHGPPPIEIQADFQKSVNAALDRDLRSAAALPADVLAKMRHRAFCSDESDGFMIIPSFHGDPELGRALFAHIDIHQYGDCPVEGWLREDLEAFFPVVEKHFGWSREKVQAELKLECVGGMDGLDPDLCMSSAEGGKFAIRIGHIFYHVMLVAVRACAARIRLGDDEPRNSITAKQINDSLRAIKGLYDGSNFAPATDAIAAELLPHQILIVDRIAKGLRRFVIAHEMGHLLLWKYDGQNGEFEVPWDSLRRMATIAKAPANQVESWAQELACDLLAFKLMQISGLDAVGAPDEFASESHLPLLWDYASIRLWMVLWDYLLRHMQLAKRPIADTHPPPSVRVIQLELAFPTWSQEFGKSMSNTLGYRLANV